MGDSHWTPVISVNATCTTSVSKQKIPQFSDYEQEVNLRTLSNNPAPNLCSTLAVGEYICCSAGSLHDLAPSPSADGTCYTDDVKSGDSCSAIAAQYTLTIDDINQFNSDRGWCGCDDLQAGHPFAFLPVIHQHHFPFPTQFVVPRCQEPISVAQTQENGML